MTSSMQDHHDAKRARILVIDDEPANLKLLQMILRADGYAQVGLLQDPREAVQRYLTMQPDLILLDLNMPHADGFEVMRQIMALKDPMRPPIVILTAQCSEDLMLRALQSGATDFLNKPFNRRELLARVHNILMAHLAHQLLQSNNQELLKVVQQRNDEVQNLRVEMFHRLGRAAELRDNETGQHVLRMSHVSALLARQMGWNDDACDLILSASPMHDIGKIGIPDEVLLKPGPLTPPEWEIMKTHTAIGADILAGSGNPLLEMASDIALSHHEKWDGSGYPRRLAGHDIPESARIVAIADVFDALTSERPYKKAWAVPDAVQFMAGQANKHFDPHMLEVFLDLVPQIEHIRARFADPHHHVIAA